MGKGLFEEMLYMSLDSEEQEEAEEQEEPVEEVAEDESANISFVGSPSYPRIFWGDSAKPLMGQFPESEYVDDNIHTTYRGLLSYLG